MRTGEAQPFPPQKNPETAVVAILGHERAGRSVTQRERYFQPASWPSGMPSRVRPAKGKGSGLGTPASAGSSRGGPRRREVRRRSRGPSVRCPLREGERSAGRREGSLCWDRKRGDGERPRPGERPRVLSREGSCPWEGGGAARVKASVMSTRDGGAENSGMVFAGSCRGVVVAACPSRRDESEKPRKETREPSGLLPGTLLSWGLRPKEGAELIGDVPSWGERPRKPYAPGPGWSRGERSGRPGGGWAAGPADSSRVGGATPQGVSRGGWRRPSWPGEERAASGG